MSSRLRLLTVLNAVFVLAAFGCGDEGGGCGEPPAKKEESSGGGFGSAPKSGGGAAAPELITADKRGNVPKPYQRPGAAAEPEKSTATISKPEIAVSTPTAARPAPAKVKVTRRKVDGIVDRVELTCKIKAVSLDGQCASAKNYLEIKERCCPGGLVERCRTVIGGVVIVGRGCEKAP
ncbi:MAG: hypothetical protein HY923_05850 [Elusimicrobia bacterium]|nr:hypothetical protein [Elusimicrobiota bacterium]